MDKIRNDFKPQHRGGALTFALMLDQVVNLSDSGIDSLKELLTKKMDCKDYQGENVGNVARNVRSIIVNRLKANDAAPHDLLKVIFTIFKTTSVDEFNQWIVN